MSFGRRSAKKWSTGRCRRFGFTRKKRACSQSCPIQGWHSAWTRGTERTGRAEELAIAGPFQHAGDRRGVEGASRAEELASAESWSNQSDGCGAEGSGRVETVATVEPS